MEPILGCLSDQVIQLADASDLKAVADKVTSEAPKVLVLDLEW